jgi:hypothetical protein
MYAGVKVIEVTLKTFAVLAPRAAVGSGGRIAFEREIRPSQQSDINVMEQRRETSFPIGPYELP